MFSIKTRAIKIFSLMTPKQKTISIISLLLNFLVGILECIGVSAIIPLIAIILGKNSIHTNKYIQRFPILSNMEYPTLIVTLCLLVVFLYILKNLVFIFVNWFQIKFSCKMQRELSVELLKVYMKCGYPFFLNHDIGYFNRGLGIDIINFYNILTLSFAIFADACTALLICFLLFLTDWQMSVSIFVSGLGCLLLMLFVFRKGMKKTGEKLRFFDAILGRLQNQTIYGMKDIIVLRRQKHFVSAISENKVQQQQFLIKQGVGTSTPVRVIEAVFVSAVIFMVGYKSLTLSDPSVFIAKLAAFAMGSFRILPSLGRLSSSINGISSRIQSIDFLYDIFKESKAYAQKHTEIDYERPLSEKDKETIVFKDKISLNNITFRYNKDFDPVLKDINLTINRGASVAFIGQSGSGKSTLMDVLLGLLVPEQGNITIDGIDITEIPLNWSKLVGYIPQSVFLTDSSIRENIAFGIPSDEIDNDRINQVVKQAKLDDFISTLEDGVNTTVGDRGVRLSGGQRQRIAIARALYHNPQIMILDEATSALDNETEAAIMDAINSLQGQVTLIIVAHRLSTVRKCDTIYRVGNKGISVCDKDELFKD